MEHEIDICDRQESVAVDLTRLRAAMLTALKSERVRSAVLSVSIVSNDEIHDLNRRHLNHDYPTDVISFQLDFSENSGADFEPNAEDSDPTNTDMPSEDGGVSDSDGVRAAGMMIEGEIIASAEMAESMAAEGQWSTQDELTLYVVHGLLHICGYDDTSDDEKRIMRSRERTIMAAIGLKAVYAEDAAGP
ncbi:MAG: rRNA maturation RNase YbeY [Planctomycetota bacterium]